MHKCKQSTKVAYVRRGCGKNVLTCDCLLGNLLAFILLKGFACCRCFSYLTGNYLILVLAEAFIILMKCEENTSFLPFYPESW